MPTVNIPEVGRVRFPDTMSHEDIVAAIENDILSPKRERESPQSHEEVTDTGPTSHEEAPPAPTITRPEGKEWTRIPRPGGLGPQLRADMPGPGKPTQAFPIQQEAMATEQQDESERIRKFERDRPLLESAPMSEEYAKAELTGQLPPERFGTLPKVSPEDLKVFGMPDTAAKAIAGTQQAIVGLADFFMTPDGAGLLGLGEVAPVAAQAFARAYLGVMAAESPKTLYDSYQSFKKGDTEGGSRELISGLLGLGFAAHGIYEALKPAPDPTIPGPVAEQQDPFAEARRSNAEQMKRDMREKGEFSPEDRVLFAGVDVDAAGTTHEKVKAHADELGIPYNPTAKPAEAAPAAKPTEEAAAPVPTVVTPPETLTAVAPETAKVLSETPGIETVEPPAPKPPSGHPIGTRVMVGGKLVEKNEAGVWVEVKKNAAPEPATPQTKGAVEITKEPEPPATDAAPPSTEDTNHYGVNGKPFWALTPDEVTANAAKLKIFQDETDAELLTRHEEAVENALLRNDPVPDNVKDAYGMTAEPELDKEAWQIKKKKWRQDPRSTQGVPKVLAVTANEMTEEHLGQFSRPELRALAHVLGSPIAGTKAQIIDRILKTFAVRSEIASDTVESLEARLSRSQLGAMLDAIKERHSFANKHAKAVMLINWRQKNRVAGTNAVADFTHFAAVEKAIAEGKDVPQFNLDEYKDQLKADDEIVGEEEQPPGATLPSDEEIEEVAPDDQPDPNVSAEPPSMLEGESTELEDPEAAAAPATEEQDADVLASAKRTELKPEKPVSPTQQDIATIVQSDQTGQQKAAALRKMADELGISIKDMQERVEAELVRLLHEAHGVTHLEAKAIFDKLVEVYEKQPTLSARTSTSVENQAYSTPIPLAYGLSHAIWTDPETALYEPTAGNGALIAGSKLPAAHGNELNDLRAAALRKFGVGTVTQHDATTFVPGGKFGQVKANPPFGTIPNVNYKGYGIKRLEHIISLKALEAMADNGRAALILGAKREVSEGGKGAQWVFENYLYGNYNVVGNFEVSGDLYSKQGASWPVRVIIIDGRKETPEVGEFAPASVDRFDTWDQVWQQVNKIHDALGEQSKGVVPGRGGTIPVRPDAGPAAPADEAAVSGDSRTDGDAAASGSEPSGTETGGDTSGTKPAPRVRKPAAPGDVQKPSNSGLPSPPASAPGVDTGRVEAGSGGQPDGDTAAAGSGSAGHGGTADADRLAKQSAVKPPPDIAGTELQDPYLSTSQGEPFGTLIPKGIADAIRQYLTNLQKLVGPIDDFVADRLNMGVDQLRKVLAAEQIDGVALAIHQIETGGALIIGDETGIGKGRQAAALIRYAILNGKIPIFFTQDPKLFTDMYGDLLDIGTSVKPFILGNSAKATIVDSSGGKLHKALSSSKQKTEMARIEAEGLEKAGYNAIFVTYSQIRDRNARQLFLEGLANENGTILILDEAHVAAGDAETSMQAAFMIGGGVKRGKGADKHIVTVPGLLRAKGTQQGQGGVLYLSATYAKTAENMPVYFRTDLRKASQNFEQIVEALVKGGVAMQQAVSEALAKAGQYIRRERDFTGVRYNMKQVGVENVEELTQQVDEVTDILNQITEFSTILRARLTAEGERSTAMTEDQTDTTDFAAIVHNQIGQLLLAAKADAVVEEAKRAVARGEKPVIALMNTMESFLGYYTEDKGIKPGQPINLRWNELLQYALSRTLRATTKTPHGDDVISTVDPANYGLEARYQSIMDAADEISTNFPVSPIDYILQKLDKAGIKVAELTGRQSGIQYTDFESGAGVYRRFKAANKNTVVNGFNDGTYAGMLLNASGSTGLSAHASSKFKDQRPRHMFIVQAAADINVFMQTLGRIRRTGMLSLGVYADTGEKYGAAYTHMVLPLQAELRPAAMAARKLKSLNANTTSAAEGAVKIESINLMNKYGDEVVAEYLDANPEMAMATGLGVSMSPDGKLEYEPDIAKKFTGRMGLLPDARQKAAYEQIVPEYKAKIEQLKASGEYDLDVVMHDDWAGKLIESTDLAPATDPSSIFTAGTQVQKWEVTDNRHAPGGVEMLEEFNRRLGSAESVRAEWQKYSNEVDERLARMRENYQAKLDGLTPPLNLPPKPGEPAAPPSKAQTEYEQQLRVAKDKLAQLETSVKNWGELSEQVEAVLRTAGEMVALSNTETGDVFDGMLVDFKTPSGSRVNKSGFRFRFAVNAPGGVVHLTGRDISGKWTIDESGLDPVDVKPAAKGARYQRYFVTGNPIQGYQSTGGQGKMVRFKAADGRVITGLMMPQKWTMGKLTQDPRYDLISGKAVLSYLENFGGSVELGNVLRIAASPYHGSEFIISTASAKSTGGKFFLDKELRDITGDFRLTGNRMVATISAEKVAEAADRIMQIASARFRPAGKDERGNRVERVAQANKSGGPPPTLEENLKDVPTKSKLASDLKEEAERKRKTGFSVAPPLGGAGLAKAAAYAKALIAELKQPMFTPFKAAVNRWQGELQKTSLEVRALQKSIESRVPSPTRRAAITNWLQADGDIPTLRARWTATTNAKLKEGYYQAMHLTPDEIAVARAIGLEYDRLGAKAQAYDLVSNILDDYVNQVWKRPKLGKQQFAQFAAKLSGTFRFGKKRTFENFFEGEQLGYKPLTKDISKLLGLYVSELGKTIATRDFLKDLTTKKAADGRPLAAPAGNARFVSGPAGEATLIRPNAKGQKTGDYKVLLFPSFNRWKWAGEDPISGAAIMLQGNLAVHPDVANHIENVLGRSAIKRWYESPSSPIEVIPKMLAQTVDEWNNITKQVMLGFFSPFHYVQEATHAIGHRVNPFWDLPALNPADPNLQRAMDHGLMLAGDRAGLEMFREGLGAQKIFEKLPIVGAWSNWFSDFLFHEYIPRLKWKTYQAILERNRAVYAKQLAAGTVSIDDIEYTSALQANAAYGHLNYADMGRDPTMQHLARIFLLAPDFLEARGRFAAQAAKGIPAKSGREQMWALATLAALFFISSRILNQFLSGDPRFDEPFGIVYKNRIYTMRSVPEDLWRLFKDTRKFIYGRSSPVIGRGLLELLTGRNYRGEKVTAAETFRDLLVAWIPIGVRNIPGIEKLSPNQVNRTVDAYESFIGSIGVQISRYSLIHKAYGLANDYMKAEGVEQDRGSYPVSKYQQLRYALEDGDLDKATDQKFLLMDKTGLTSAKLAQGFHESLFHPWTKSKDMDKKFLRSLSPEDTEIVREAQKQRERVWKRFQKIHAAAR